MQGSPPPCFHTGCVPIPQGLFAPGCQFVVGPCELPVSPGVLVAQLVWRHSCVADRLPVVVRFPAGPRVSLKTVDPPKGNGLAPGLDPSHLRRYPSRRG